MLASPNIFTVFTRWNVQSRSTVNHLLATDQNILGMAMVKVDISLFMPKSRTFNIWNTLPTYPSKYSLVNIVHFGKGWIYS